MAESEQNNTMTNKFYDVLKFIAQIILPALATLYLAVSEIWGLPYGFQIVGTITAVDTFLGLVLKAVSDQYYRNDGNFAGTVVVQDQPQGPPELMLQLDSKQALDDIPGKHSVEFNVKKVKA